MESSLANRRFAPLEGKSGHPLTEQQLARKCSMIVRRKGRDGMLQILADLARLGVGGHTLGGLAPHVPLLPHLDPCKGTTSAYQHRTTIRTFSAWAADTLLAAWILS